MAGLGKVDKFQADIPSTFCSVCYTNQLDSQLWNKGTYQPIDYILKPFEWTECRRNGYQLIGVRITLGKHYQCSPLPLQFHWKLWSGLYHREYTLFDLEQAGESQVDIWCTSHSLCCRKNQRGSLLGRDKDLYVSLEKDGRFCLRTMKAIVAELLKVTV